MIGLFLASWIEDTMRWPRYEKASMITRTQTTFSPTVLLQDNHDIFTFTGPLEQPIKIKLYTADIPLSNQVANEKMCVFGHDNIEFRES